MKSEVWSHVDKYLFGLLLSPDATLEATLADSAAAGLPAIQVAPNQGMLLHLLARVRGARSILEVGTLGGYSTTWLARALPAGGRLLSLEFSPKHAEVARANIARAGLESVVEVIVGPAAESMKRLRDEGAGPFDFIFIDADKASYPEYLELSLELSAARYGHRGRQHRAGRPGAGRLQRRCGRSRRAPLPGAAGQRAARGRHGHPDGGRERARRVRAGPSRGVGLEAVAVVSAGDRER